MYDSRISLFVLLLSSYRSVRVFRLLFALYHSNRDTTQFHQARSNDSATRKQLTEKVSVLKRSLITTKSDFKRAKEDAESHSLIGSRSQNDRQRFNDTNEK